MKTSIYALSRRTLLTCLALVMFPLAVNAASKEEIDANVEEALAKFSEESPAGKRMAERAVGMIVFPKVIKAGIGIGGEYGEGALIVNGQTIDYYSTAAASIGFQLGAQVKSQIIMFMTDEALSTFRNSEGWEAGVDGSVALIEFGAGGEISSNSAQSPIIGFIFSNKGLMYNLTFEGSKMTKLNR
ncbi:MAG: BPSL1445 family SYLF domain-containing lipoprotein [Gammaproteobacteria bacterium]